MKTYTFADSGQTLHTYDVTGSDLRIDVPISTALAARTLKGTIADETFPRVTVPLQNGLVPVSSPEGWRVLDQPERAPGTSAKEVKFDVGTVNFNTIHRAFRMEIPMEDRYGADPGWRLYESGGKYLHDLLKVAKEKRAIAAMTNVSTTHVCNSGWHLGGDPVIAINAMMDQMRAREGRRPNLLVFGADAWPAFAINSHTLNRSGKTVMTTALAGDMFRARVVLSEAYYSEPTAPASVAPFLRDSVFACVAPPPGEGLIFTPVWGLTPTWTPPGLPGPYAVEIHGYDFNRKTTAIEVGVWETEIVVDPRLGVLITGTSSSQAGGI